MKNKSKLWVGLFALLLISIAIIGFTKVVSANKDLNNGSENYTIVKTWELPDELDEVSGIAWIDNHTIACVQDEDGLIYFYDLDKRSVIKEIPFTEKGDFEGLATHGNDIYVMQSNGLLYEVKNWKDTNPTVTSYETGFKSSNNMESLAYSQKDNCLLTVPKNKDIEEDFKGIYKIPLDTKKSEVERAVYKIDMNAEALKAYKSEKLFKTFNPSEIAVHPKSNDIYVLEGRNPKLMILNSYGKIKKVYQLDELNFPQPEGMTFSSSGDFYISSEAAGNKATIHLVEMNF